MNWWDEFKDAFDDVLFFAPFITLVGAMLVLIIWLLCKLGVLWLTLKYIAAWVVLTILIAALVTVIRRIHKQRRNK